MFQRKWILHVAAISVISIGSVTSSFASFKGEDFGPVSFPHDCGWLIGLQGGYVDTHWSDINQNAFLNATIIARDDTGWGARPYVGYAFNRLVAAELGYTFLGNAKISRWNQSSFRNVRQTKITNRAIDLSLRLSAPIFGAGGLFTRVGAAYLMSYKSIAWIPEIVLPISEPPIKQNTSAFNVTFGFGAFYDFPCGYRVEASWTRFNGDPRTSDSYQPYSDFFAVGLSYRF